MHGRRLVVIGGGIVTVMVLALVLGLAGAGPLGGRPDGCTPLVAPSSAARAVPGQAVADAETLDDDRLVFADRLWEVRAIDGDPTTVGVWSHQQAEVRDDGALVLRQQFRDGVWHNAEVHSVERGFGYGTYEWTIESPLVSFDPVVVLGLFTFERGAPGGREIDIEVAQWGDPDADNMNFVSWFPERHVRSWTIDDGRPTTHLFTWMPDRIVWCSQDADGELLAWAAREVALPPGDERVHMNLWIARGVPPAEETEVVITDFTFHPLDPELH